MYRRNLLGVLGSGLAGLAGCASTSSDSSRPGTTISGDRIFVRNASENVLSFEMRILEADSGATLYQHTTTFDPDETIGLGEGSEAETVRFRIGTPDGDSTVFERLVAPTEQYDLVIRSQTTVEVEHHVER